MPLLCVFPPQTGSDRVHSDSMPRSADDLLLVEVENANTRGIERYLASGASINGSEQSGEEYPPVVYAAATGSAKMVKFLLRKGADVDGATWRRGSFPKHSRAVHAAVSSGYAGALDALRAVLNGGANANAKDALGCTALMMVCRMVAKSPAQRVLMARELLEAGADATLQDADGRVALHSAAFCGHTDLIDLLLSGGSLPTLNYVTLDGKTPLTVAVEFDRSSVVSLLLSAGASQKGLRRTDSYQCPFKGAVSKGYENVVRILASERGMEAVGGGSEVIPRALACATQRGTARILRLVLAAEGDERQTYWASHKLFMDRPMVYLAAAYGVLANVIVLLAVGACETVSDPEGLTAIDVVGGMLPEGDLDPREAAAIGRALQRGPAYRAQSWAWPNEEAGAGNAAAPLAVQVFRPRSPKFFVRLIGR